MTERRRRQLLIEPLEPRIVLGVILSAGDTFDYLDAEGQWQRLGVSSGSIDVDGIEQWWVSDQVDRLTVLEAGTVFSSSGINITELVASDGVTTFTAQLGTDVFDGSTTRGASSGTLGSLLTQAGSTAVVIIGSETTAGNLTNFEVVGGDWAGSLTVFGQVGSATVAGDVQAGGQLQAAEFQTISIGGDIAGQILTSAGGAVGSLSADSLSGSVTLGTAGDRGAISTLTLGDVTGAGELRAAIDGDGLLLYQGQNLTTSAGATFAVNSAGLSLQGNSLSAFSYGATSVTLSGGALGYFELAAADYDIGIYLTTTPAGSTIAVANAANAAEIDAIGADGISASLDSIDIQGNLSLLGGAANRNTGDIVNVGTLRMDGLLGTAGISGAGGTWTIGGAVTATSTGAGLDSLTVGGALGSLSVGQSLGLLDVTGNVNSLSVTGALADATIGGALGTASLGSVTGLLAADSLSTSLGVTDNMAGLSIVDEIAGTVTVGGEAGMLAAGGNVAGDISIGGALTTFSAGGNLSSAVSVGNTLGTAEVGGDLSGSLSTGNNKSIGSVEVDGAITGQVTAGNAGQRGTIQSIAYGSVEGAGLILGKIDGSGQLLWNDETLLAPAGLRFQVDATGLALNEAAGAVTIGNVQIVTGQTGGGTTQARIFASHDRSIIDINLSALGTGATLSVTDTLGADGAHIRNVGISGISGSMASISIAGNLQTLGGAANVAGGSLVDLADLTVAGNVESATITGSAAGVWSAGGSFGTVTIGGVLDGSLLAAVDVAQLSAGSISGSVMASGGDIGSVTTTSGDLGGTITAADEIGRLTAAEELTARVIGRIYSGGNLGRFGQTSGQLALSENAGAVAGSVNIVGSAHVSLNNTADVDYAAVMTGGIEIDLSAISSGASITSDLALDGVTAGSNVALVDVGTNDLGRYRQTAGAFSGSIVAGAVNHVVLASHLAVGGSIAAASTQLISVGGDLLGAVSTTGGAGQVSVVGDMAGGLNIGLDVASIDIGQNATGSISAGGNVTSLDVTGNASGDVTVGSNLVALNVGGELSSNLNVTGNLTTGLVGGDLSGTMQAGGNIGSVDTGGSLSGTLQSDGAITSVVVQADMTGTLQADAGLGTLDVTGNLSGTVTSGAGQSIDSVSVGGALTGGISAGTLADRGAMEAISYGSISGPATVTGEIAADGTLDWDGRQISAEAGRAFDIDANGLALESGSAAITIANRHVELGQSAGLTAARYWVSHDLADFDLYATALGTDATISVTDTAAGDAANVRNLAMDGVSGNLSALSVEGRVTQLGGAANVNGGSIVDLGSVVLAAGADAIAIDGNWTGSLTSGGNVGAMQIGSDLGDAALDTFSATAFGDVTVGGNIVGTLATTSGSIGNLSANSIAGAVDSAAAIGTVTTAADLGGTVAAATGIADISAGGNLSATVTATAASIGNVGVTGHLSGSLSAATNIGDVTVAGSLSGALLAGGEIGNIAATGELSGSVSAADIGHVTTGQEFSGSVSTTTGNVGNLTVQSGGMSGTTQAAGAIGLIDITGNLDGSIESAATITGATISGDLSGTLRSTAGSVDTLAAGSISGTVEAATSVGSVTAGSDISGSIEAIGGSLGDIVATAGSISGTLRADQNIRSVLADEVLATALIEAIQGDIGSLTTDTGNLAGTIRAGDEIGSISAAGALLADVSGSVRSGGNLAALGQISGLFSYSEHGAEVGRLTAAAGVADFRLNDSADTDVLDPVTMAGGIDLDLTINNVAAAIATTVDVDRLVAASDMASISIDGRLGGASFAAALSGDMTVTGDVQNLTLSASQTVASAIAIGGNLVELDAAGHQSGAIDIIGNATTVNLGANQAGGLTIGGTLGTLTVVGNQTGTMDVTGTVTAFNIGGEQGGTIITGGNVETIAIDAAQTGDLTAGGTVINLTVAGDQTGTITIASHAGSIELGANQLGDVTVGGLVGIFNVAGDQNGTVGVTGNITSLDIDGEQAGSFTVQSYVDMADIGLDQSGTLAIAGHADTITINGSQTGNLTFGNTLSALAIGGDQTGIIDVTGASSVIHIVGEQGGIITTHNNVDTIRTFADQTGDLTVGGTLGTLDIAGNQTGTVDTVGTTTLLRVRQNLAGTITTGGAITTLDVDGNLAATGSVSTAAGQAIGVIDIGGTLDGTVQAGTAGSRGDVSTVTYGSAGLGSIDGRFDAGNQLSVNGSNWTLDPGSTNDFTLQNDELRMASVGGLTRDTFSLQLTESAGATLGRVVVALDGTYLSLHLTQLGTDAGISVSNADATETQVNAIGFDGISGNLTEIAIDGSLVSLGGASNANGGNIVDVDDLTISGTLGTANISGGVSGTWQSTAASLGEMTFGGTVSGTITAQQNIGSLTAAALAPGAVVQTISGDIGSISTTSGAMAGTIVAADEIGRLNAAGALTAVVTGYVDSAGNIDALGQTPGRFSFSSAHGSNGVTVTAGRAEVRLNDPTDTDATFMPVDFDVRGASSGSALAIDGSIDTIVWTSHAGGLTMGGDLWHGQVGGDLSGTTVVGGRIEKLEVAGSASGTLSAGRISNLRIGGNSEGTITTAAYQPIDTLYVGGAISGRVLAGGSTDTRGSMTSITASGGVSGLVQGNFNSTGRLLYNGVTYTIQPNFPFRIDSGGLQPEFTSMEQAYRPPSGTDSTGMTLGAAPVAALNDAAARADQLAGAAAGTARRASGAASSSPGGGYHGRLWTVDMSRGGGSADPSIDPARQAAYGDVSPWLIPLEDYRMHSRGQGLTDGGDAPGMADDQSPAESEESWRLQDLLEETARDSQTTGSGPLSATVDRLMMGLKLGAERLLASMGLTTGPEEVAQEPAETADSENQ